MNSHDAKFLLRAARPGGRDAADPMFTEALGEAERDPMLKAWREREERFDSAIAGKLREIVPPAGLKEAILAGARASERRAVWWRRPGRLAAAASVAIVFAMLGRLTLGGGPSVEQLATVAMQDLAQAHDEHVGYPAELAQVQTRLAAGGSMQAVQLDLDELRRNNCRSLRIGGREVFEICFQRGGVWYHLYAMSGGDRPAGLLWREREVGAAEPMAVAAWGDAKNSYALVTSAGREALRRLL